MFPKAYFQNIWLKSGNSAVIMNILNLNTKKNTTSYLKNIDEIMAYIVITGSNISEKESTLEYY